MKILQVHNEYQQYGGEDAVVESEYNLLRDNSHDVKQYIVSNLSINSLAKKINVLLSTHYSKESYKNFSKLLDDYEPDVVHVHNFFPLLTPSIFDACLDFGIPSALTLHNFRLVDPSAILMNQGKVDERSLTGSAYKSILGKVYRNSYLQTAVVAHMIEYHRRRRTWLSVPDIFIALTDFSKSKFVKGGIPENKIVVKPNFVDDVGLNREESSNHFLYVGRLSEEKGIRTMLKAWNNYKDCHLLIVGDGPLANEVKSFVESCSNVTYLGKMPKDEVITLMKKSKALIFPSIWYEGFPMVIVEALACGLPVITSNIGSQAEIIEEGYTGLHFDANNPLSLRNSIIRFDEDRKLQKTLSLNCRDEFLKKYSSKKNIKELISIYNLILKK